MNGGDYVAQMKSNNPTMQSYSKNKKGCIERDTPTHVHTMYEYILGNWTQNQWSGFSEMKYVMRSESDSLAGNISNIIARWYGMSSIICDSWFIPRNHM